MNIIKSIVPKTITNDGVIKKSKVAIYARVSTQKELQKTSFDLQIDAYYKKISKNHQWIFAGVFADFGKSGTNTKYREQLNNMIELCRLGEIDIILTKSLSRFARNTIDALSLIQELRSLGIEIIFEKENISSLHSGFDLLISVYSSFAEEESKSISNNCKWSIKKRFKNGVNNTAYLYGYVFNENGEFIINENEAENVRLIFDTYIEGKTTNEIINILYKKGVKTFFGNDKFHPSVIKKMIKNEKYCGNALLQKTYVPKVGQRWALANNNKEDKYLIENNHEGIISVATFEKAQAITEARRQKLAINTGSKSKLTDYYKFVYSIEAHRFYRYKVNRKNSDTATPFLHLFDFIGDSEVKPIYCSQVTTAGEMIVNEIKADLKGFKTKVQQELNERLKDADIPIKITQIEEQIKAIDKKIEYAKDMKINETAINDILNRLAKEKIEIEDRLASFNCENIMNYSYFKNMKIFEERLALCKEPTTTDLRLLFQNIIALKRDELLFCIKLTNKNPNEIVLENVVLNKPIIEGSFKFVQTRIKLDVKWKVIII